MKKKAQRSKYSSSGVTYFLTTLIVLASIVLLYLIGILLCPPFARLTLKLPAVSSFTKILAGNLYSGESLTKLYVDEKKSQKKQAMVTTQAPKQEEKSAILDRRISVDESYFDHCMFLGDSRTVAMVPYGYLSESQTLAQVGLAHSDAMHTTYTYASGNQYTFSSYLAYHNAEVIYISYGVNGIGYLEDEEYKEKYEELVDAVMEREPDSKIVIQSIWPVREGTASTARITNSAIDMYNDFLLELAEEKGCYYLDTESILKNEYNSMNTDYDGGDGLHYNKTGYEKIVNYMLSHPVPGIMDSTQ